eukprot:g3988.t1
MGRVSRYKKAKSVTLGFRDDDRHDIAPPRKKGAKKKIVDGYSMQEFKAMLVKASSKKKRRNIGSAKTNRDSAAVAKQTGANSKVEDNEEKDRPAIAEKKGSKQQKQSHMVKRKEGESLKSFNRRMAVENNRILIQSAKASQKTTAKRKRYLEEKRRKKKLAKATARDRAGDDGDDVRNFRKAESVPFGATNDTVPTLSIVPRRFDPPQKRKKASGVSFRKKSSLSPAALKIERAKVMEAYKKMLERRKQGGGSSLVAFDRVTGSRIWSVEANGTIESSPTASGNGRVVFGSVDGSVRSVNASTGEAMWTFASGGSVLSSPSVVRSKDNKTGAAIFGNSQGTLFSLDLLSGTVVWSLETNGSIVGTGQYDETKQSILIGTIGDGASILEAVDAQSGVSKWHQGEVLMPFCSLGLVTTPAISRDGRSLYLTCQRSGGNSHSGGGSSFALRADLTDDPSVPLNIVWNVSFGVVAGRSPLLSRSETALFVSVGSDVYAIDSATGATLWSQVGIGTNLSPTSHYFDKSGDKEAIVVGTADGDVVALNGTSGEVAWASFGVDSEGVYAAPVFGDDGVLYAAGATRLIAYGVN